MKSTTFNLLLSSIVLSASAMAVAPAHAQTHAGEAYGYSFHQTQYDVFTDGKNGINHPDPYTDGARDVMSPRNPYSDGARDIKSARDPYSDGARDIKSVRDPYSDGARTASSGQIAGMDRTGVSAPPEIGSSAKIAGMDRTGPSAPPGYSLETPNGFAV